MQNCAMNTAVLPNTLVVSPQVSDVAFDYGELAPADVESLDQHARTITHTRTVARTQAVDWLIAIGRELAAAQQRFSHHRNGRFIKWCWERCGLPRSSVYRYIGVYFLLTEYCPTVGQYLDPTALYLLAHKKCPESVRRDMLELASAGNHISRQMVSNAIEQRPASPGIPGTERLAPSSTSPQTACLVALACETKLQHRIERVINQAVRQSIAACDIARVLRACADALEGDGVAKDPPEASVHGTREIEVETAVSRPHSGGSEVKAAPLPAERNLPLSVSSSDHDEDNQEVTFMPLTMPATAELPPPNCSVATGCMDAGESHPTVVFKNVAYEGYVRGKAAFYRRKGADDRSWCEAGVAMAKLIYDACAHGQRQAAGQP